jgi:hypothetical protein
MARDRRQELVPRTTGARRNRRDISALSHGIQITPNGYTTLDEIDTSCDKMTPATGNGIA